MSTEYRKGRLIALVLLVTISLGAASLIASDDSGRPTRSASHSAKLPVQVTAQTVALGPAGAPASAFPRPHRPVASIISDQWSTEDRRDDDGEAKQVIKFLKIEPGMTVADIGAGRGYYTVRLARQVGPNGRVFAVDVVPAYLQALRHRIRAEGLTNVTLSLGEPHDPRLLPKSIDIALMVHTYHEVEQPYGLMYNLLPALKVGGRVAIIDLDQPSEKHGMPFERLLCEVHALGFRQVEYGWLRGNREYVSLLEPPSQQPELDQIKPCPQ